MSGGTLRSLRASSNEEQFAFRGGEIVTERGAKRVIEFKLDRRKATAVSIGSTEHYTLPKLAPQLTEVNAGLGWFGPASRLVSLASAAGRQAERIPRRVDRDRTRDRRRAGRPRDEFEGAPLRTFGRLARAGPHQRRRDRQGREGNELSRVQLDGPNPYDLTGAAVAFAAGRAEDGLIKGAGALGPVEAFGLEELRQGCEAFGLREVN